MPIYINAILILDRLLHSRILLFRPLLTQCCSVSDLNSYPSGMLTEQMLERCASECIKAAQSTISIVIQYSMHDIRTILPAWWYRVFYTYTAAMVLAVSTLRLDLFPRSMTEGAWRDALMIFKDNEHLSEAVKFCKAALQRMVARIEQTQDASTSALLVDSNRGTEDVAESGYATLLQDLPYHYDFESLFNFDHIM